MCDEDQRKSVDDDFHSGLGFLHKLVDVAKQTIKFNHSIESVLTQ